MPNFKLQLTTTTTKAGTKWQQNKVKLQLTTTTTKAGTKWQQNKQPTDSKIRIALQPLMGLTLIKTLTLSMPRCHLKTTD